jgi:hypothetical protein
VNWTEALFEVIDLRSFSNLWYWIGLAILWSSMSHWVLGVPFDMIHRARRHGGQAETDLADLVRINVNRLLHIAGIAGLPLAGVACFVLTSLALLAFWYDIELAQAVFLIAFPLSIVGVISLASARKIAARAPEGEELRRMLIRHRLWTQIVGMIAIFVTAMWGMIHNLEVPQGF